MRGRAILVACTAALAFAAPALAAPPHLAPSDRDAVDKTLDIFVNHAVKRHNPAAAYDVLTPTMKAGMTRNQWNRGDIPVYPYPAAGKRFHVLVHRCAVEKCHAQATAHCVLNGGTGQCGGGR